MKVRAKLYTNFDYGYNRLKVCIKFPKDWYYRSYCYTVPDSSYTSGKRYPTTTEILEIVSDMDKIEELVKKFTLQRIQDEGLDNKAIAQRDAIDKAIKAFNERKFKFEIDVGEYDG